MSSSAPECFHCGLPVPADTRFHTVVLDQEREFCCLGCEAVAKAIVESGLSDFYRYRDRPSRRAEDLIPQGLSLYDREDVQKSFVRTQGAHTREADLILEGITCAACIWLNERQVNSLAGVLEFRVNYTTHRAHLRWDDSQLKLSQVLAAITAIGYHAHPFDPNRQEALHKKERAVALRHLAVAALGMMQVMMLAVSLWMGKTEGMDPQMEQFLRWMCLAFSLPVVFYSGLSFFRNAWRDLQLHRLGMDVPVALAIASTFAASTWSTVAGHGEIYYESITMFVFLLLTGRFLEMNARQRAGQVAEALARLQPALATRITEHGDEVVAAAELQPGDRVRIKPGEGVPADGVVESGVSSVDESLLTGESLPCPKHVGAPLVAGTVNVESPLVMQVEKVGQDTTLSAIQRLLDRAQSEKPAIARWTERGTGWFVLTILVLTVLTGAVWYVWIDPAHSFEVMLAMLVVSCPCALALATPAALTVATGWLTCQGVLTTRGHALETLAAANCVVFDKTGTLTQGRLSLSQTMTFGSATEAQCLALAAALEQHSEHPLARLLARYPSDQSATEVLATPGGGVQGLMAGQCYRIGQPQYVAQLYAYSAEQQQQLEQLISAHPEASAVVLAGEQSGLLALFLLTDTLRPEAQRTVDGLRQRGLRPVLLSGDGEGAVRYVAQQLGISDWKARLSPEGKLAELQALQNSGAVVLMVGDGVNDAPVLSAAHVSAAMAGGTQLAHASADLLLYADQLERLLEARDTAVRTLQIIRQNLYWSLLYNALALPVAAMGWITPWLAALGMSLSSLLVVLNALRLRQAPVANLQRPLATTEVQQP